MRDETWTLTAIGGETYLPEIGGVSVALRMTITEFRDNHQKSMHPAVLEAGLYLERQGLIFGHDFVTGDALDLAAAFITRKYDEREEEEILERFSEQYEGRRNRFEKEDWSRRYD